MIESPIRAGQYFYLHKLAAVHLQAPERQIGYCTPMKNVAYNKFNNIVVSSVIDDRLLSTAAH